MLKDDGSSIGVTSELIIGDVVKPMSSVGELTNNCFTVNTARDSASWIEEPKSGSNVPNFAKGNGYYLWARLKPTVTDGSRNVAGMGDGPRLVRKHIGKLGCVGLGRTVSSAAHPPPLAQKVLGRRLRGTRLTFVGARCGLR